MAAGVGLMRAGVMFWAIFVIGWTAHESELLYLQKDCTRPLIYL